ncbi:MAG: hypothetical protein OCD01_05645 [Fibrobacterales bacterium]
MMIEKYEICSIIMSYNVMTQKGWVIHGNKSDIKAVFRKYFNRKSPSQKRHNVIIGPDYEFNMVRQHFDRVISKLVEEGVAVEL